jgi:twitching motility protein PilT
MPGVDQILSFIVQQGADELRLGTDDEPQAFAQGVRRHFTMAKTPDAVLRHLLGDVLSKDRESLLVKQPLLRFSYEARGVGTFDVALEARKTGGLNVTFTQSTASPVSPPEPEPVVASVTHATSTPVQSVSREATGDSVAGTLTCTALLRAIVEQAMQQRASDIHAADNEPVYIRIDGQLNPINKGSCTSVESLFQLDEALRNQLLRGIAVEAAISTSARERLRITLYQASAGLTAAIRLLPAEAPTLAELQLPLNLAGLAELPNGLVLLCGATGSGKSSTLAALSRHALEQRSILLVTLEDPIEFQLRASTRSIVRQRQIGHDTESFTAGLRDALRSDPDIIVVGELRDPETIRLALTAAETGHLVLASLHSGSAAACVERVVDAYPADQRSQIRVQLADALRAVVVQRLLPRHRGSGRIAALEVLRVNRAVANVIREAKTAQLGTLLQAGKREGMISLERCLADYVQSGAVSLEQARAAANDADSLAMYLAK